MMTHWLTNHKRLTKFMVAVVAVGSAIYIYGLSLPKEWHSSVRGISLLSQEIVWEQFSQPEKWPGLIAELNHPEAVTKLESLVYRIQENPLVSYTLKFSVMEQGRKGRAELVESDYFAGSFVEFELSPIVRNPQELQPAIPKEIQKGTEVIIQEYLKIPSPWARVYTQVFRSLGTTEKVLARGLVFPQIQIEKK